MINDKTWRTNWNWCVGLKTSANLNPYPVNNMTFSCWYHSWARGWETHYSNHGYAWSMLHWFFFFIWRHFEHPEKVLIFADEVVVSLHIEKTDKLWCLRGNRVGECTSKTPYLSTLVCKYRRLDIINRHFSCLLWRGFQDESRNVWHDIHRFILDLQQYSSR